MIEPAATARTRRHEDADRDDSNEEEGVTRVSPFVRMIQIEEDDDELLGVDDEEMLALIESSTDNMEAGKIIHGTVVRVSDKEVMVDVHLKAEGVISISEFGEARHELKAGDEIEVFLDQLEDDNGRPVLSKQRADFIRVWDRIRSAYDAEEPVEGALKKRIKGGVIVNLYGVPAFLPGSQIDLKPVKNIDAILGESYEFKIIKFNKRRGNIVISRRKLLEERRKVLRDRVLVDLEKGQIRDGVVKNITDFGAFIDLGGIDGLLHITDMSWGRITHPSNLLEIGQEMRVKILEFDRERERISLGLKQLETYPWDNIGAKYPEASVVCGRVVSIVDYGAFIELEKGVEGLIHISEMSWTRNVRHPSKILTVGDDVNVKVLRVDAENEKISLGLKQVEPDPWDTLDEEFPIGTRLLGKVRNLTNFGAFVEIIEGIDGLVHISDMSWTKRVRHPSEVVKKGDDVEVVILNIDKENRRISLGMKQVGDDPWSSVTNFFNVGDEVEATIHRVVEKGLVVDLPNNYEGFVPISQVGQQAAGRKLTDLFKDGDKIPMKLIEIDPLERRIVLSIRAYTEDRNQPEEEYLRKHSHIQEVGGESLGAKLSEAFAAKGQGDEEPESSEDQAQE